MILRREAGERACSQERRGEQEPRVDIVESVLDQRDMFGGSHDEVTRRHRCVPRRPPMQLLITRRVLDLLAPKSSIRPKMIKDHGFK